MEERIRAGRVGSLLSITDVRRIESYQQLAREESRLGIPLIVGKPCGSVRTRPVACAAALRWSSVGDVQQFHFQAPVAVEAGAL
jgi:hypothetical protein